MCLLTRQSVKVAEADITTYKVMLVDSWNYRSPYLLEHYRVGKLKTIEKFNVVESLDGYVAIYEGLHSYLHLDRARRSGASICYAEIATIFKCTIPKGTQYYTNGESIASLALRLDKEIPSPSYKANATVQHSLTHC